MFDWLFRRAADAAHGSREDVKQALGRIVRIAPQVRLANRYETRLAAAVGETLRYARELVDALPAARDATPAAWSGDAHLRAMFATADDITEVLGRSSDVRAWFDEHFASEHLHAVLSSRFTERRVLCQALEGGTMRADVARIAVSFNDKRIRICDETDAALRQEIVMRVVEQLALEGMSRVAAHDERREALKEQRALLVARKQMLGRRGAGMSALAGDASNVNDAARLERDIAENEQALAALGSRAESVEQQLRVLIDIYGQPASLIRVTKRTLRVSQMNLIVEDGSEERGAEVSLSLAYLPMQPPETRAVEFVRIARRDLPPAGAAFGEAARWVL